MRKEIEALKDLRAVMARRAEVIDTARFFELGAEMGVAMAMTLRLMNAGVLLLSDFEIGEEAHKPDAEGGADVRFVRVRLRHLFIERMKAIQPPLTPVAIASTDQYIDDLIAFVVEVAAYRRSYVFLVEGVIDAKTRYKKLRIPPALDRAERLDRVSYRQDDPNTVLEEALVAVQEARIRMSWTRARLCRLRKQASVKPVVKTRGRPKSQRSLDGQASGELRSVQRILQSFHGEDLEKRLAKLRRLPDRLLRDAGIEDGPATVATD